jgi:acyl phosphate:glycerol-3-phosphate acyltransferase
MPLSQLAKTLLVYGALPLAGFVWGGIPTAYLVARKVKGIDIREHGSLNVGGTNVWRVCGRRWGLLTYLLDFLKGLLPVWLMAQWLPHHAWATVVMGLAVVLGHSKSVFLGFSGGKSSITGLGTLLAMQPLAGLVMGVMAFLIIKLTRYVSVASLVCASTVWAVMLAFKAPMPFVIYAALIGVYVIIRHKANIQRLLQGTENRLP